MSTWVDVVVVHAAVVAAFGVALAVAVAGEAWLDRRLRCR